MRTTRSSSPPTSLTPPRTTRRSPRCWTRRWPIPQTTPEQTLADAGYFSEDNVNTAAERGTDPLIATGRLKHGEQVPDAPRGRIPKNATAKQRMARKLRTKQAKAAYARRKVIVEPVFGQMKTTQGADRLLLRGRDNARSEWRLLAACHNLRKLAGFTRTAKPMATA